MNIFDYHSEKYNEIYKMTLSEYVEKSNPDFFDTNEIWWKRENYPRRDNCPVRIMYVNNRVWKIDWYKHSGLYNDGPVIMSVQGNDDATLLNFSFYHLDKPYFYMPSFILRCNTGIRLKWFNHNMDNTDEINEWITKKNIELDEYYSIKNDVDRMFFRLKWM